MDFGGKGDPARKTMFKKGIIRNKWELSRTEERWRDTRWKERRVAQRREETTVWRERERAVGRKGGVKQTRLRTHSDRRHSERTEGETTVLLGDWRRATAPSNRTSIAGSLPLEPSAKETNISGLLFNSCRTNAGRYWTAAHCTHWGSYLSCSTFFWVDLLLRGVKHGSMEEGCHRDPPTKDRGELEPFGAVAAVLDYLEDSCTDRRWEVCLPLANRYLKHQ